jgi:hypothetical protein
MERGQAIGHGERFNRELSNDRTERSILRDLRDVILDARRLILPEELSEFIAKDSKSGHARAVEQFESAAAAFRFEGLAETIHHADRILFLKGVYRRRSGGRCLSAKCRRQAKQANASDGEGASKPNG